MNVLEGAVACGDSLWIMYLKERWGGESYCYIVHVDITQSRKLEFSLKPSVYIEGIDKQMEYKAISFILPSIQ